jgi:hypothetical protein
MNMISGWSHRALMIITLALVALALVVPAALAGDKTVIWQTQDGYVAVVPQDTAKNMPVVPNNQPAELSEDLLIGLLGSLQVRDTMKDKPTPLFTESSLQRVAPYLQQAFRKAGPGEDVIFVIIGLYKTLYGLANKPLATSGRLFYQGGKLNLILSVVKDEGQNRLEAMNRDFRLIAVGSRQNVAQGEWSLVPSEEQPFEMPRRDWVVLDPKVAFVAKPLPTVAPLSPAAAQSVKKGAERPLTERLATLTELKDKGLITEDEYKVKRRDIMNEKEPERTPAERLATLNELKKKALITDEEYRAKRMQILSDL